MSTFNQSTADDFPYAFSEKEEKPSLRFMAVGDIMLSRGVGNRIRKYGNQWLFEDVKTALGDSDILFGNLECPLTTRYKPAKNKTTFIGNPQMADELANVGFDVLSVANNHALDQGRSGLEHTLDYLKNAGIKAAGGGIGTDEPYGSVILSHNGISIAFIAAQNVLSSNPVPHKAGIAYLDVNHQVNEIKSVRKKVDFIIVSLHWGNEYVHNPTYEQKEIAHKLIDSGANIIIGHHSHVLQGIEKYENGLIAYSLGNFAFDQHDEKTKESIILVIDLFKDGKYSNPGVVPIRIGDFRPEIDYGPSGERIAKDLAGYCKVLGPGGITRFDILLPVKDLLNEKEKRTDQKNSSPVKEDENLPHGVF